MLLESRECYGYNVIRVQQEPGEEIDFSRVEEFVRKHLGEGSRRIALSLSVNAYPYSKLISFLVHCNKLVEQHQAELAVVQPNPDLMDVLKKTKLHEVFRVESSEEALGDS